MAEAAVDLAEEVSAAEAVGLIVAVSAEEEVSTAAALGAVDLIAAVLGVKASTAAALAAVSTAAAASLEEVAVILLMQVFAPADIRKINSAAIVVVRPAASIGLVATSSAPKQPPAPTV